MEKGKHFARTLLMKQLREREMERIKRKTDRKVYGDWEKSKESIWREMMEGKRKNDKDREEEEGKSNSGCKRDAEM